jgi:hypothetical protein
VNDVLSKETDVEIKVIAFYYMMHAKNRFTGLEKWFNYS